MTGAGVIPAKTLGHEYLAFDLEFDRRQFILDQLVFCTPHRSRPPVKDRVSPRLSVPEPAPSNRPAPLASATQVPKPSRSFGLVALVKLMNGEPTGKAFCSASSTKSRWAVVVQEIIKLGAQRIEQAT